MHMTSNNQIVNRAGDLTDEAKVTAKFAEFVAKAEPAMPLSAVNAAGPRLAENFRSFAAKAERTLEYSKSGENLSEAFERFIHYALPQVFADIQRVLPEIAERASLAARWLVNDDLLAVAGCRFVEDAYTELMAWALSPDTHPPSAQRRQSAWLASLGLNSETFCGKECQPRTQVHTEDGIPDLVMAYGNATVAVEAKTGTNEHFAPSGEMQTIAYVESLRKALDLSPEHPLHMVFLTTDGGKAANKEAICATYVEFVLALAGALDGSGLPADTRAAFAILFTHLLTCATETNTDVRRMIREIQAWSQQHDWCDFRNISRRCNTLLEAIEYFKPERKI
jgi:hypothetical protein